MPEIPAPYSPKWECCCEYVIEMAYKPCSQCLKDNHNKCKYPREVARAKSDQAN